MLVLSRKLGERIWIGDDVCITLVDIDRGKVRVGIEAPRAVPVYREEVLPADDPRTEQNRRSAAAAARLARAGEGGGGIGPA